MPQQELAVPPKEPGLDRQLQSNGSGNGAAAKHCDFKARANGDSRLPLCSALHTHRPNGPQPMLAIMLKTMMSTMTKITPPTTFQTIADE